MCQFSIVLYTDKCCGISYLYGHLEVLEALDRGYAQGGYPAAVRLAAQTLASRSRQSYVPPVWIAELYTEAGEKDRALEWLEKVYEQREGGDSLSLSVDPRWDSLRSNPRFQDLLRRMNAVGLPSPPSVRAARISLVVQKLRSRQ